MEGEFKAPVKDKRAEKEAGETERRGELEPVQERDKISSMTSHTGRQPIVSHLEYIQHSGKTKKTPNTLQ